MLKKLLIGILLNILPLFGAFATTAYTVESIPNVHLADRTRYVSNPDGILSIGTTAQLDSIIGSIWEQTTAEVAVVAVKSIGGDEINDFATRLFEHWKIGKKDKSNGLLVLMVEDQRQAVLRTGYGAEGLLPDVICGRIIRDDMIPSFRNGDYDSGMLKAVAHIHALLTSPEAMEELRSKYANDRQTTIAGGELFSLYTDFAGIVAILMLLVVFFKAYASRKKDPYERYFQLKQLLLPTIIVAFVTLGMGIPTLLVLWFALWRCRNKKRVCPNCRSKMHKLPENEDNQYLTPSQDLEEQLNSVDYDVWLCDKCGEVDVYPFINKNTPYQECRVCHAKTSMLVGDRLILKSTANHEGKGVKIFKCRNCGAQTELTYIVPKEDVPVIVPFIGGFGSGRGGGGFGGGSFGGGMTGGGGASGGW